MSDPAAFLARLRAVNDRLAAWPAELRLPERNPRSLVQPAHVAAALDAGKNRLAGLLERILIAQEVESRARVGRAWERRLEAMNRHLQQRVETLTLQAADLRAIVTEAVAAPDGSRGHSRIEPRPVQTDVLTSTMLRPAPRAIRANPPRPLYEPIRPRSRTPAPARTALPEVRDTSAAREAMLVLLADHPDLLAAYGERLGMFDFTDTIAGVAAGALLAWGILSEGMRAELRAMLSPIDRRALDRTIGDLEARSEGLDDLLGRSEKTC